ncbi:hypothetical protein [Photobacterium sp. 1_MG-2023]|uniref:hypothetical protein n=1 Tax=Photobacterium sp. 1_MG-2023 TaxID=3062646 RepID=UPI0026E32ED8|nr:hypothetical protein [Photobacterium sp. 1_MG-2023]MDO6705802.1 hypothetical protein [Photobacterium sp. 1_MG-2023]
MKHRRVSNKRVKQLLEEAGIRDPHQDAIRHDSDTMREHQQRQQGNDKDFTIESDRK